MNKEIGKLYWNPEQECVVKLFDIDYNHVIWPYKYDLLDGDGVEGQHKDASWTCELWDEVEILDEIKALEEQINILRDAIKLMKEHN